MGRRIRTALLAAVVAGGMLLGTAGTGVAKTAKVKATAKDKWKKIHTYIGKGDKVVWKNRDSEDHDVTFYRGIKFSRDLAPGERVKKRFKKKKTYLYRCVIHSGIVDGGCQGMCGFVHVL